MGNRAVLIFCLIPMLLSVLLEPVNAQTEAHWQKTYGGTKDDVGLSVEQTSDGGYIIAGSTKGPDVYLVKTDASGNLLWQKTYGGGGYDIGYSVKQTSDGGYIIAGMTSSFGVGGVDVYLVKTDASGNLLWQKTYGGGGYDIGNSVQQTSDDGYVIAGSISFGAGDLDVYLLKTDSSGKQLWQRNYGGAGYDIGNSVQQTSDGGYIIAGSTSSFGSAIRYVYLVKTDASGYAGAGPTLTPPTPTLISPSTTVGITDQPITFTWTNSSGATDYQIEVNGPTQISTNTSKTNYVATLSSGYYLWRVRALSSAGYSNWTSPWSLTVLPVSTPPTAKITQSSTVKDEYRVGDTVSIQTEIENTGQSDSTFWASIDIRGPHPSDELRLALQSGVIAAGSRRSFSFPWKITDGLDAGSYNMTARVYDKNPANSTAQLLDSYDMGYTVMIDKGVPYLEEVYGALCALIVLGIVVIFLRNKYHIEVTRKDKT
jgi:hypothetical protein